MAEPTYDFDLFTIGASRCIIPTTYHAHDDTDEPGLLTQTAAAAQSSSSFALQRPVTAAGTLLPQPPILRLSSRRRLRRRPCLPHVLLLRRQGGGARSPPAVSRCHSLLLHLRRLNAPPQPPTNTPSRSLAPRSARCRTGQSPPRPPAAPAGRASFAAACRRSCSSLAPPTGAYTQRPAAPLRTLPRFPLADPLPHRCRRLSTLS